MSHEASGSGEGPKQFLAGAVDFGASDAALSDAEMAAVTPGAQLVPVMAGSIVLAYNLDGLGGPLKLSRAVYVDIFLGNITSWDDPRLQQLNPGLKLLRQDIALVVRQDGSGTTYAFTNHLSAISTEWRERGPSVGSLIAGAIPEHPALPELAKWPGLQSVIIVETIRAAYPGAAVMSDYRVCLSSFVRSATAFVTMIRQYGDIGNKLHWSLDGTFNEDRCRLRKEHAPENVAAGRHVALNLLRQEQSHHISRRQQPLLCRLDESYLLPVLSGAT